ncbi:MAG: hypothetical protein IJT35_07650, partial [Paludibacteraceae bacterium]|nr:hypothetical protein [Paludibacteraceae bacterium]
TAENNILFFTGKSKSGNRIVEDMQKKIDQQKQQLKEIEAKIYAIDNTEAEPAEKAEQVEKTETAE